MTDDFEMTGIKPEPMPWKDLAVVALWVALVVLSIWYTVEFWGCTPRIGALPRC